jgi:hypothetical protein
VGGGRQGEDSGREAGLPVCALQPSPVYPPAELRLASGFASHYLLSHFGPMLHLDGSASSCSRSSSSCSHASSRSFGEVGVLSSLPPNTLHRLFSSSRSSSHDQSHASSHAPPSHPPTNEVGL